jgi:hypothetical protein
MLALDDPRWSDLRHAYGSAADIPPLLHMLRRPGPQPGGPEDEPWFSLWSSLCHQGDVYSASYAAVPHLVQIAREAPTPLDFSFLQLPAAIEVARATGRGPELPADCAEDYRRAIADLIEVIALHRHDRWDQSMLLSVAAAQAVANGHIDLAEALLNLDDDWIARINDPAFD